MSYDNLPEVRYFAFVAKLPIRRKSYKYRWGPEFKHMSFVDLTQDSCLMGVKCLFDDPELSIFA